MSEAGVPAPVFCSGATGYIGSTILRHLVAQGTPALAGVRTQHILPKGETGLVTGDLSIPGLVLPPVSAVVHAAGLGHRRGVPADAWQRANVDAALNLARAAKAAGASRFVLISTAYVYGRVHQGLVNDKTAPNPMDVYAQSKWDAEEACAAAFGPGFCAIRPVAVLGPGCPGNVQLLLKCLLRGIPLPFGAIANRRSFIDRDDLAAIVLAALAAPKLPEYVLAAHPESISTPELILALAEGAGVKARLPPCPPQLLALGASLMGRPEMWQALSGDFAANPVAAQSLGYKPLRSLRETLAQAARYYVTTRQRA